MNDPETIKIAVVEDILLLRKGICHLLAGNQHFQLVLEAEHGEDFLDQLKTKKLQVDVCLLDISMPLMDGHQTIVQLRKQYPRMKVLVLSMFDDDYNVIRMLRNGANGYVLKTAHPEEISKAINDIYQKGFYHSELVNLHFLNLMQQKDDTNGGLTDKDLLFLSYCCSELTYKEIAEQMRVSPRTVEGYRDILCEKLSIKSRTGLVMYAMKIGVTPYLPGV